MKKKKSNKVYNKGMGSKGSVVMKLVMAIIWLVIVGGGYYLFLPALNVHSIGMWMFFIFVCCVPAAILSGIYYLIMKSYYRVEASEKLVSGSVGVGLVLFALVLAGLLCGAKIFHAKKYASVLKVEETDFITDINQSTAVTKIALMDTNSAIILGNREIGSLSKVVSQYNVSEEYTQIDLQGNPVKVSALDYAGFFKYTGNKDNGIPGYVQVDPVNQKAKYVELEKGMNYVPSAYFSKDLKRHIRFKYPTKIIKYIHFEVNEEGKPYYVCSVADYTIGLFGGETVKGAIICDPVTGDMDYYDLKDIPNWVDKVFDGDLLAEQYNWHGKYSSGFWNSIFGKKNVKKCTETRDISEDEEEEESDSGEMTSDYGYVAKDGDIWIYTGVTSVNDDASNIGFILVNQRTSEAHYYNIPGADENSAMEAAEGEVQEKGYRASFPSLVNVEGQPTYIMVLKDSNGIAKLFAMVNVESYNIVTTDADIDGCFDKYKKKLVDEGIVENLSNTSGSADSSDDDEKEEKEEAVELTFVVESIHYMDVDGDTWVYFVAKDGNVYKQKFSDNEQLIFVKKGDEIKANCVDQGDNIFRMEQIVTDEENKETENEEDKETEKQSEKETEQKVED